jgi:hypothetical protein
MFLATFLMVQLSLSILHQTPKAAFRLFWVFCLVCIVARAPPERLALPEKSALLPANSEAMFAAAPPRKLEAGGRCLLLPPAGSESPMLNQQKGTFVYQKFLFCLSIAKAMAYHRR